MGFRRWIGTALLMGVVAAGMLPAHGQSIFDRMKQRAKDKLNQQVDRSTDAATDAVTDGATNSAKPASSSEEAKPAEPNTSSTAAPEGSVAGSANAATPQAAIRSYQNYDFVPGEQVIFYDDFTSTQDGEFPEQWELSKGQAVVNKMGGYEAFLLTDGNYAQVSPRVKTKTYLPAQFTLEYDTYVVPGAYPLHVEMDQGDQNATVYVSRDEASYESNGVHLAGSLPAALREDAYDGKWHHVAIIYRKPQMKVYVDQYRVLTVPDTKLAPESLVMEGIGDQEKPIVFRNVRVAAGGGMNMVGQKFTDAKIVTHGINFDVDKATLRPESMGTLNQIKTLMTNDPSLKFEVDGHTDNSGSADHNLGLSQQRAEAVRAQLVSMGIDASRLTAKGYGDTRPLGPNDTPEDKATNRRVEFVRAS